MTDGGGAKHGVWVTDGLGTKEFSFLIQEESVVDPEGLVCDWVVKPIFLKLLDVKTLNISLYRLESFLMNFMLTVVLLVIWVNMSAYIFLVKSFSLFCLIQWNPLFRPWIVNCLKFKDGWNFKDRVEIVFRNSVIE